MAFPMLSWKMCVGIEWAQSTCQAWGKLDFQRNYIYALLQVQVISIFLDILDGKV